MANAQITVADCYVLGRLTRPHGLHGEIKATLSVQDLDAYLDLEQIYVLRQGRLSPYVVEGISPTKGTEVIMGFEAVNSVEDAQALMGCELYLPLAALPPLQGNEFYHFEIIGYAVYDAASGAIGTAAEVQPLPANDLLRVLHPTGREVLVPLVPEFIVRIDRDARALYLALPPGLLEVYLQEDGKRDSEEGE